MSPPTREHGILQLHHDLNLAVGNTIFIKVQNLLLPFDVVCLLGFSRSPLFVILFIYCVSGNAVEESPVVASTRCQALGSDIPPNPTKPSIPQGEPDLSKNNKTLTCSLTSHRKPLCSQNAHQNCTHDVPPKPNAWHIPKKDCLPSSFIPCLHATLPAPLCLCSRVACWITHED